MDSITTTFISATGISSTTIQNALDAFVVRIRKTGLLPKMVAIYPIVGGSASTHKFNLLNPVDTDAGFRIVFTGGWTHSSTGMVGNGSTGYADTKINLQEKVNYNDYHISFYSRTTTASSGDQVPFGVFGASNQTSLDFNTTNKATCYMGGGDNTYSFTVNSVPGYDKLWVLNRPSETVFDAWRNGSKLSTNSKMQYNRFSPNNLYISALNNNGTPAFYSPYECSFFTVGDGLTDSEVLILNESVNTFQTALSR